MKMKNDANPLNDKDKYSGGGVITPKTDKEPRRVEGYRITQYTQPRTAAAKIAEKFGPEWSAELIRELTEVLSRESGAADVVVESAEARSDARVAPARL